MSEFEQMSREDLERYAEQLKKENDLLLEAMEDLRSEVESSKASEAEILSELNSVLERDRPDVTHYDTSGVQDAMAQLRESVDEQKSRLDDISDNS
jgi:hypothetical protein